MEHTKLGKKTEIQRQIESTQRLLDIQTKIANITENIRSYIATHPEDEEGSGGKLDEMYQELDKITHERTNLENPGFTEQTAQEIMEGLLALPAEDIKDEELDSRKKYIESQIAWAKQRNQDEVLKKLEEYLDKLQTRTVLTPPPTEEKKIDSETTPTTETKEERLARERKLNKERKILNDIEREFKIPLEKTKLKRQRRAFSNLLQWEGLATRPELKAKLEERIQTISDILNGRIDITNSSLGQKTPTPETARESAIATLEKEIEKIKRRMEERNRKTEELLKLLAEIEEEEKRQEESKKQKPTQVVEGEIIDGGEAIKKFLFQNKRRGASDEVS